MRRSDLKTSKVLPIRHNPALVKRLLVDEPVSCVRHLSQAIFRVKGEEVLLKKGSCLVVEPGEAHSIEKVSKITELLFMLVER